jgi:hypothetical protein
MGWSDISFLALGSLHNPTFFQELAKYYNTIELAYNNTLANYYPATVFKDDNNNDNYHVRLLSGEDIGDINDTAINYALNIAYQGDSGYVLNTTVPGPNDIDDDGDTFTENQGDCHDSDPDIYPNAPEICDSKDNQCPGDPGYGEIDEGCQPPQPDYSVMTQNYYGTEYYIAVGIHSSTFDHAEVIAGPNIVSTWDNHAYLSQRPEVGDTYTIRLCYDELCNNYEEITYTVTSINDNFAWIFSPAQCQPINTSTPLIEWQQAPGVVTNYHMNIHNITNGGDDLIWGVRFSADTTSCTYNFNGTAQELLEAGRVYRIYLHAYDENINQATTVSTFYYQYLPAPTGLSATYDSNNNWNWITWQSVPCATYNLYWGTEPGVTKDSEFAGNTPNTEFSHTGVVPGWTYYYRVSSVNSAGESELSSEVSVYVPEVPLYITNPGFEDFVLSDGFFTIPPNGRSLPFGIFDNNPIPGWTITVVPGRGSFEVEAGTFNPNSTRYPGQAPEGQNIAYSNGPTISQVLGAVLTASATYSLQVDVGRRLDEASPGYVVSLLADGTVLAQDVNTLSSAPGTFVTSTVTFNVPLDHPALEKPLEIRLEPFSFAEAGAQVNFDNVRLYQNQRP